MAPKYTQPLKNPDLIPGQGELITFLPQTGREVAADVFAPLKPEDGVSVDLATRISALGQAVSELAQASKLSGFHTATSSEEFPRLRAPIERQYEDVDQVAGRAQDKRARHMLSAKQAFARAIGLPQMIAAEADPKEQERMKQEAAAEFGEFTQKYGDAKGAENRKELRKSLRKVERELAKVSRKQAL